MGHIQLLLQSKADMTNMIICILQSSKVVLEGDIRMDGGWSELRGRHCTTDSLYIELPQ